MKLRSTEYYLLFILAFAPWHGAGRFLPEIQSNHFLFRHLSSTGLLNLVLIMGLILFLAPHLLESYRKSKPKIVELIILAWPLLNIINFKNLDAAGVVMLENSILMGILLAVLIRREEIFKNAVLLKNFGFEIFAISYFLAVFVPLFLSVESYSVFRNVGPIARFRGWSGVGALAFSGTALAAWSIIRVTNLPIDRKRFFSSMLGLLLSLVGVYLTVLRIGLLSICFMIFTAIIFNYFHRNWRKLFILIFFFFLSIVAGISPVFMNKSHLSETSSFKNDTVVKKIKKKKIIKKKEIESLWAWPKNISTSGNFRVSY